MKKAKERRLSRLVLGHLERISGGVFDRFSGVITDLVGGKSGIYALYRKNTLYYVGLATDLKKRLNRHLKDRHKGKWNYFSLYLVRKVDMLKDLESLTIRIAYPKGNKTRGKFGGAPDLRRALRSKIKTKVMEEISGLLGKRRGRATTSAEKRKATKAGRAAADTRKKTAKQIPLKGLLKGKRLRGTYKGKLLRAWVYLPTPVPGTRPRRNLLARQALRSRNPLSASRRRVRPQRTWGDGGADHKDTKSTKRHEDEGEE